MIKNITTQIKENINMQNLNVVFKYIFLKFLRYLSDKNNLEALI